MVCLAFSPTMAHSYTHSAVDGFLSDGPVSIDISKGHERRQCNAIQYNTIQYNAMEVMS